ncbi:MAG: HDOD domain-containing protein [Massilia sp.]
MIPSSPAPLVYFRVIADRIGRPGALVLDIGPGQVEALRPLTEAPAFKLLTTALPCFHRQELAPALVAMLAAAGWSELPPGTLRRLDQPLVTSCLPSAARWLDGNWCMTAPAKPVGAQVASRTRALQLVQLVAADAATHEIEALLRLDPTLAYNLLRLVNSVGIGGGRRVTSFAQALLILGRQQLRRWLNLMLFAARDGDNRASLLLARVMVRAGAIEQLARLRGLDKYTQEQGFMVGLFSLLGALFGMSMADVLAPLALGDAVQHALLRKDGELGALLQVAEAAEQACLEQVAGQLKDLQLAPAQFNQTMLETTAWMLGALKPQQGAHHG